MKSLTYNIYLFIFIKNNIPSRFKKKKNKEREYPLQQSSFTSCTGNVTQAALRRSVSCHLRHQPIACNHVKSGGPYSIEAIVSHLIEHAGL